MGVWGRIGTNKKLTMKQIDKYIKNSNKELLRQAQIALKGFRKKAKKKERKQRRYENRIPKKYEQYIKSPFWEKRRNEFYKKYGKICAVCGGSKYIHLHHAIYGKYGFEKDEHLIVDIDKFETWG